MRFHALLPVRDEADIIAQCLSHLLTWADAVYVFDTGSVDDSWEIVLDFASRERRIIPLRKDNVFFSETRLRGWMFNEARKTMRDGDWFLRVDADEFHHVPPPEFVKNQMESHETIAWHQYYDFKFTQSELEGWGKDRETVADRSRPIEERRRWFTPSVYSEPRLCRYRESMRWPPTVSFPFNAGFVAQNRLPIRHYPHRDPVQMERRCRLRAVMMADPENRSNWSEPELHHWAQHEWRTFVTPNETTGLQYWETGSNLPNYSFTNHIAPAHIRSVQRVVHTMLLPVLDATRPKWPAEARPQPIPQDVIERLAQSDSRA